MKRQRQRTLRNICIPGTHQSATAPTAHRLNRSPMSLGWARTQNKDIGLQLDAGVRFFDIGVTSAAVAGNAARKLGSSTEIWCRSGSDDSPVALCCPLRDVLEVIRDFISANPSEIVAIHVTSGEGQGDRRASVNWNDCQTVVNQILRDKLIPEHMREMPIGNFTLIYNAT